MIPKTAGQLGEWGLLARYLPSLGRGLPAGVKVGPGDDAAVVDPGPGRPLWAVTTDMLVEGVHFRREWTSGEDLGHKALAVNLSDLAAMGDVTPSFGVVSLGITPKIPVSFVDKFYRGLQKLALFYRFSLVGGDTVRSDRVVVSITALGWIKRNKRPLLRSGARPGDVLFTTGTLGDAAAGLAILEGGSAGRRAPGAPFLTGRLLRPQPRLAWARTLAAAGGVTSLMDSSDGLWRSAQILARASGVGIEIQAGSVPISPALRRWAAARGRSPLDWALAGGEDYELIFTASPAAAERIAARSWARAIGRIVPRGRGIKIFEDGKIRRSPIEFEHFND